MSISNIEADFNKQCRDKSVGLYNDLEEAIQTSGEQMGDEELHLCRKIEGKGLFIKLKDYHTEDS